MNKDEYLKKEIKETEINIKKLEKELDTKEKEIENLNSLLYENLNSLLYNYRVKISENESKINNITKKIKKVKGGKNG